MNIHDVIDNIGYATYLYVLQSAHRAASLVLDPRSMMQADRNGGGVTRGGFMSDYSSSYIPRDQSARSSTNSPRQRYILGILTRTQDPGTLPSWALLDFKLCPRVPELKK